MSLSKYWKPILMGLIYLISLELLYWQEDRSNFGSLITSYTITFICYLILLRFRNKAHNIYLSIALLALLGSLFFQPHLSNDYYRFLWDGELITLGHNPLDETPNTLIATGELNSDYFNELHAGMSELSARHYTCYPTVNQLYFMAAAAVSDDLSTNILSLRLLIIVTILIGAVYLFKLLDELGLCRDRGWVLLLNPLFIVESVGNLHFEGVMISFLIIAFFYIIRYKEFMGGVFLSFAIFIKLLPIILLPFFLRILKLRRSIALYSTVSICSLFLGIVFINTNNYTHFLDSLGLYFNSFEFNSFLFYPLTELGKSAFKLYDIQYYSSILSLITIVIIAFLAFYREPVSWLSVFKRITLSLFVYLLLSSTVHPWYLITLMSISVFTNYSFALFWSFLAFLSYQYYSHCDYHDLTYRILIALEYLIVITIALIELIKGRPLLKGILSSKENR